MEVVSPENPAHDYQTKRTEYAQAGIAEYWIVLAGFEVSAAEIFAAASLS